MGYILKCDLPKYSSSEYNRRTIKYGTGILKRGNAIYLPHKFQDPITGYGLTQDILNLKNKDILQHFTEVPNVLSKEDFAEKSIQEILNLTKNGSGFMDIIKFITGNISTFKNIAEAISTGSNTVKNVVNTVQDIKKVLSKPPTQLISTHKGISDEAKQRILQGKIPDALTQTLAQEISKEAKSGDGFFFI